MDARIGEHMDRFLRIRDVLAITGRSRTRLYEDIKKGNFPKPVKIGPGAVAWSEAEVSAWQAARLAERGGAGRPVS